MQTQTQTEEMTKKTATTTGTQVPEKQQKMEVALPFDYGTHAGAGTDDLSQAERGVPYLRVLQPLSPQVVGPEGRIEGARPGQIVNTGTGALYDTLTIVPVLRTHTIKEWRPRNQGGGLVEQTIITPGADYPDFFKAAVARCKAEGRKFGKFWTGEPDKSNQLKETYDVFAVILDGNQNPIGMGVFSFASTAIPVYRKQFSRRIGQIPGRPPMFAFPITITTQFKSAEGNSWFVPVISFPVENNPVKSMLDPKSAAFKAGAELFNLVTTGQVAAEEPKNDDDDAGPAEQSNF